MIMNNVIPPPPQVQFESLCCPTSRLSCWGLPLARVGFLDIYLKKAKGTLTTSGPGGESTTSLAAKRRASYDLKGCNDDKVLEQNGERLAEVHKRIWQVHMWCGSCCWSRERKAYYDGKRQAFKEQFHVTSAQKDDLMQWLRTAVKSAANKRV
jgi:hypothetical protein